MARPLDIPHLLERWRYFEEAHLALNESRPSKVYEGKVFGETPLVFCAPHATKMFARGRLKLNEGRTGSLADLLAEYFGGTSIKTVGYPLSTAPLKDEAAVLAEGKILFDLHGMQDNYGIDMNIGLGPAPDSTTDKICRHILTYAQASHLKASVNAPFSAKATHTITRLIQSRGGQALQLEFSHKCRDLRNHDKNGSVLKTLILALKERGFDS